MEGRWVAWCSGVGLFISALGCHRDSYTVNSSLPQPSQMVGAPPPSTGLFPTKAAAPTATATGVATPGLTTEVAATPKKKKGPLSAESEVAFAETHIEVALHDPPPSNRDELLDLARARFQRAL